MPSAQNVPFRLPQELQQPYKAHVTFTHTNTGNTAETAATISTNMEEANKVALIVDTYDAYIAFDETATSSKMLVPAGTGYFDENIVIKNYISIINASTGNNSRIRGIAWGR